VEEEEACIAREGGWAGMQGEGGREGRDGGERGSLTHISNTLATH
jgi:hypothetical protein